MAAFAALLAASACVDQTDELSFRIELQCPEDAESVASVRASIRRGECGDNGIVLYDETVVLRAPWPALPSVEPGAHAFSVEALNEAGTVVASDCQTQVLPSSAVILRLRPETGTCGDSAGMDAGSVLTGDDDGSFDSIDAPAGDAAATDAAAHDAGEAGVTPDDRDGDGVEDEQDSHPDDPLRCTDSDGDGCDDCALLGVADPARDGFEGDGDGQCDCVVLVDAEAGGGDGTRWAEAFSSLHSALSSPNTSAGCELWLAEGTYYSPLGDIELKDDVSIYGGFAGGETLRAERDWEAHPTIIDGRSGPGSGFHSRHVLVGGANAVLDGVTVQQGRADGDFADGDGAGLDTDGHDMVVRNCRFVNNQADDNGGAILAEGVQLTVDNCVFESNTAALGGAIHARTGSQVTVTASRFSDNHALGGDGGAIYSTGTAASRLSISGAVFERNLAQQQGGAISVDDGVFNLTTSTFTGNQGDTNQDATSDGGAITIEGGANFSVSSCTFQGNTGARGGAIRTSDCDGSVLNSYFLENTTRKAGGAISVQAAPSQVNITSCVFWSNRTTEADNAGGALHVSDATVNLYNSTFAMNDANHTEGGDSVDATGAETSVAIRNTILYDEAPIRVTDGTVDTHYSLVRGSAATENGNLDADPRFRDATTGDLRLRPTSPCLDAGDGNFAPATDIDGRPRVDRVDVDDTGQGVPSYTDMGAHERL